MYMDVQETQEQRFTRLMTKQARRTLMNHAYRLARHTQDAEDLMMETELKVFRKINLVEDEAKFTNWCMRIMNRVFLDIKRARDRRIKPVYFEDAPIEDEMTFEVPDTAEGALDVLLEREKRDQFLSLVKELPDKYRVLIEMDIQEATYNEMAATVNCKLGTVRAKMFRARQLLKKHVTKQAHVHDLF